MPSKEDEQRVGTTIVSCGLSDSDESESETKPRTASKFRRGGYCELVVRAASRDLEICASSVDFYYAGCWRL